MKAMFNQFKKHGFANLERISTELHEPTDSIISVYKAYIGQGVWMYTAGVSKGCIKKTLNFWYGTAATARLYAVENICFKLV